MKLGQNVCLMDSRTSLKMSHVGSKTRSPSQILRKSCVRSRGHIFFFSLVRVFALMIYWVSLKMGLIESKTRSAGQTLEKPCVRPKGHIFSSVLFKDGQNVCLDNMSDEFENGLCWV